MRRLNKRCLALIAVCMAACMLLSCCASAAHTAEHACSYYDDCHFCRLLGHAKGFGMLAMALLFGCAFMRSPKRACRDHARRRFVPITLISQSIQMND